MIFPHPVQKLICLVQAYTTGRKGATAIEYALIAAGVALFISASVWAFGDAIYTLLYSDLSNALESP